MKYALAAIAAVFTVAVFALAGARLWWADNGGQTEHGYLELLRKRGMDEDVDFLQEALRVLVDGIMDAEVSAQIGAEHDERN